jgi:hypothetical protein
MRNCFTYRIGWSQLNEFYYGVRYARGCHPSDLWVSYFTSSRHVEACRKLHGEPDIIQVRREFGDNPDKAVKWELKVLRRMNIGTNPRYLNRTRRNAFGGRSEVWNIGRTKLNCHITKVTSQKISKSRKGQKSSERTKERLSQVQRVRWRENSWSQLKSNSSLYDRFLSHEDFLEEVKRNYGVCWRIPSVIADSMGVTLDGVMTVLKHLALPFSIDQGRTKVFKNYGNKFASYEDYCISILVLHAKGYSPNQIDNQLGVNVCGVTNLVKKMGLTCNRSKTGPSKLGFQQVLVADALEAKLTTFTLEDNPLSEDLRMKLREAIG